MALTPCMSCLKSCGYLCGGLAALNIWFWLGMTIFNSMNNVFIKQEFLLMPLDGNSSEFTKVFAIVVIVSLHSYPSNNFPVSNSLTSFAWLAAVAAQNPHAIRTKMLLSTTLAIRDSRVRTSVLCVESTEADPTLQWCQESLRRRGRAQTAWLDQS